MGRPRLRLSRYVQALALVGIAGAVANGLAHVLSMAEPALVLLTGVVCAAVLYGLGPSLVAAIASLLVYDYWFVAPLYTLTVAQSQDVVALGVFLVVAVLTSQITVRVRRQEERATTAAVMEAIEDGMIVLDATGVVVHANEIAGAILQVEPAATIGQHIDRLATRHPHYLRIRAAVDAFLAHPEREGERIEITLFLRGRDHSFLLRPTPLRAGDGSADGLILALQDVTYLRDQEAQREALVATLSHELRTPLTSLGMALELLDRDGHDLGAERPQVLAAAKEDVGRLRDVAQRLLDLSRARAMTIALERRAVDLPEVISRVVRMFGVQAREKGVTIETAAPPYAVSISGDDTKLMWAVSNLVSNALRYTPAGGSVRISLTCDDASAHVAVRDTGPGIPPELRDRIFERFAQAPDAGDIGSAGLGLAIVRDIVQAHGGRIHLDSAVGRGSRFVLELPRE